ncbi:hypothetical protein [Microtetraspora malaysiensis]|uniref:hypothetical protein n=1 Tax=Microtetraspora malaysiensis TaxID=161358 RepID=UPI003D8B7D4D
MGPRGPGASGGDDGRDPADPHHPGGAPGRGRHASARPGGDAPEARATRHTAAQTAAHTVARVPIGARTGARTGVRAVFRAGGRVVRATPVRAAALPLPAELTGPLPAVLTEPEDERPGRTRDRRPGGARRRPLSDEPTRPVPVLSRERPIARNTSLKIAVIVLAGAAGTVTGIKILGPALDGEAPARSLQSVAVETARSDPSAQGIFDDPGPADDQSLGNGPLRIPATVTLDEFGRGTMTLTVSEGAEGSISWRISAPGLVVTPAKGTLKRGGSGVVSVRALRVRYWCGDPEAVTAPLTVHGPSESITTTVRWRTC